VIDIPVRDRHGDHGDAAPSIVLLDALVVRGRKLAGVQVADAEDAPAGSRALLLHVSLARGPAAAFRCGLEFAHLRPPDDGRLSLNLPSPERAIALTTGWAVEATTDRALLVFGPRDRGELDIVWELLHRSYRFARGLAVG
jgi:hypothetical protein